MALIGCGTKASPSSSGDPTGDPSTSGGTSGVVTAPPTSEAPTVSVPTTSADLIAYIQNGTERSPDNYADEYGGMVSFSTPSGNISCGFAITDTWVMCWVDKNSWPTIAAKTCEDGDWNANWVTAAKGGVKRGACLSEQPFPMPGEVLPYGSFLSIGQIACRSEATFLACANLPTGNGFVVSKATLQTYGPALP